MFIRQVLTLWGADLDEHGRLDDGKQCPANLEAQAHNLLHFWASK